MIHYHRVFFFVIFASWFNNSESKHLRGRSLWISFLCSLYPFLFSDLTFKGEFSLVLLFYLPFLNAYCSSHISLGVLSCESIFNWESQSDELLESWPFLLIARLLFFFIRKRSCLLKSAFSITLIYFCYLTKLTMSSSFLTLCSHSSIRFLNLELNQHQFKVLAGFHELRSCS